MKIVEGILYTKGHEWVRVEGEKATVGITDFAQHSLGEIVYIELPAVGARFSAGDALGVVESVKSASDIYSPVGGEVLQINEALPDAPEKLNEAPFESWIAVLKVGEAPEGLMDAAAYQAYCESEE
ncbi:MAG: glycine cleavage system protein GcvH [Clostridiales bacterium]|nr:glycine cleavage system protein GcvH [Clostridiales bacterium]